MNKINFNEWTDSVKDAWEVQDITFVNDAALRVAKIDGAYDWHTHREEDEFFMVLKGKIFIDTPEGAVELNENEGFKVKRGTRHRSRSDAPAWVLLVEPVKTKTKGE